MRTRIRRAWRETSVDRTRPVMDGQSLMDRRFATTWSDCGGCRRFRLQKRMLAPLLHGIGAGCGGWGPGPGGVSVHHGLRGCKHGCAEDAASVEASCRVQDRLDASRRPLVLGWMVGQRYRLLTVLRRGLPSRAERVTFFRMARCRLQQGSRNPCLRVCIRGIRDETIPLRPRQGGSAPTQARFAMTPPRRDRALKRLLPEE
jgi:hypothetical protein